jgi:hypothetical protein
MRNAKKRVRFNQTYFINALRDALDLDPIPYKNEKRRVQA